MDKKQRTAILIGQNKLMKGVDFSIVLVRRIMEIASSQMIRNSYENKNVNRTKYETFNLFESAKKDALKYTIEATRDIVSEILTSTQVISKAIEREWLKSETKKDFKKEVFLSSLIYGKTLEERVREYFNVLEDEVTLFIRAGFKHDIPKKVLVNDFIAHREYPLKSEIAALAVTEGLGRLKGMSASKSIARVVEDVSTRGIHATNAYFWRRASGKEIVTSGDSHVCENCKSLENRTFKMDEQLLPVHTGCRCMEVPIP